MDGWGVCEFPWRRWLVLLFALGMGIGGMVSWSGWCAGVRAQGVSGVLIYAVHVGASGYGGDDEAVALINATALTLTLDNTWALEDAHGDAVSFPPSGVELRPGEVIWCARNAISFTALFGYSPDLEYGVDSDPAVPDMGLNARFALANDGGRVALVRRVLVDSANGDGGEWPAGSSSPRRSMERVDPTAPDEPVNWDTAVTDAIGLDAEGMPIWGTPRAANSVVADSLQGDGPAVVINEVAWMGTSASSSDEWIELRNNTDEAVDLSGWLLTSEDGSPTVYLSGTIEAGGYYLLERTDDHTVSNVPADQIYSGALGNSGERLFLYRVEPVDVLVYGDGEEGDGWSGPGVRPLSGFDEDGQLFTRKLDPVSGLPLQDTDTAADWAQDPDDPVYGRRVRYPGWDVERYSHTVKVTETAHLTIAIGPDHLYETIAAAIGRARREVLFEGYTLENPHLVRAITEVLEAGVPVTILLEGGPVGGIDDAERWGCAQIAAYPQAQVYMLHDGDGILGRYRYQHAKVLIVDGREAWVGSANWTPNGMPADAKGDGTWGHREVVLGTDAPRVVEHLRGLFLRDCDPSHHRDVVLWGSLGYTAPVSYTPVYTSDRWGYAVRFTEPVVVSGTMAFEVVQAPENAMQPNEGVLGLLGEVGAGDTVDVEQLREDREWGDGTPNPRLEAYVGAARRGARVRVLLDAYYDDGANELTCAWLNGIAAEEGLDLACRLGNPTGLGIHNKMILVRLGEEGVVHVGSLNGTEGAHKVNREVALQVNDREAYDLLLSLFEHDWQAAEVHHFYLPLVLMRYAPPARHVLFSEVHFKGVEWFELYNPSAEEVDLEGWWVGDAVEADDYERLHRFPAGARIGPGGVIVVARRAADFFERYGVWPDYELEESAPGVIDLLRSDWGRGECLLGNAGDELVLLRPDRVPVDVVVWGDGVYAGVLPFKAVDAVGVEESLVRDPPDRDTEDCGTDFRVGVPSPGTVAVSP